MPRPIYIKVGGAGPYDPVAGTFDCNIPYIKGMDMYLDNVPPAAYSVLSTGGFRVVDAFVLDAEYYVQLSGIAYGTDSTNYTNGFNMAQVMAAIFGRVGWMQPNGTADPVLNATNLIARSGRKFNDTSFHALVTLQNIKTVMEQIDADDTDFNSYLEGLQRAVIMRCMNTIFSPPELVTQTPLYRRYGYLDTPIENTGKFIAWRLQLPPAIDLATQIDTIALYFDQDVTFNLYLFNDAKAAPVWMAEVSAVANTQTMVSLADIVLNYIGAANLGGIFYLGYFQNDLGSARAIREQATSFKTGLPFLATMIEVAAIGANDFDRQHIGYSGWQAYGMNLDVSVFRDHTQQIVKKAALFDNVIGLQMAAQVVEQITFTKRSSGDQRLLSDVGSQLAASMDLTGTVPVQDAPQIPGLRGLVTKEIARVRDSFFPRPKPRSVPLC